MRMAHPGVGYCEDLGIYNGWTTRALPAGVSESACKVGRMLCEKSVADFELRLLFPGADKDRDNTVLGPEAW